jgi:peptidoglycan-associated lipoprotein
MACNQDSDCLETQLCLNAMCTDIKPGMAECGSLRVHFDFDRSELHRNDELALDRAARCIMAEQKPRIVIEGNADERGTEEYNLALGDRRANAVARYLEERGVRRDDLRTVSYGKDKPLCYAHNETCWAENRRAAIKQDHLAPTASRG